MTDIRTVQVDLDALREAHKIASEMVVVVSSKIIHSALAGGGTAETVVDDSIALGEAVGRRDAIAALIQGFEAQGVRYN